MRACLCIQDSSRTYFNVVKPLFDSRSLIHGDLFNGNFIASNTSDSFANYKGSGYFVMGNTELFQMPVTNRQANIITSLQGSIIKDLTEIRGFPSVYDGDGYLLAKHLTHMNECHDSFTGTFNYADRIKNIINTFQGSWSLCTLYAATYARSRLIIATSQRDIYFHVVYKPSEKFFALVWTDELEVFDNISRDFSVYSISPLAHNKLIVIHPMYLIDKWRKWTTRCNDKTTYLSAVSTLEKYLIRTGR